MRRWLSAIARGFGRITLDPSPRLRRLREQQEGMVKHRSGEPLPPLPGFASPPGAVPPSDGEAPLSSAP